MAEEKKTKKKKQPKNKMKGAIVESETAVLCYFCGKDIKLKRDLASVQVPLNKGTGQVIDVARNVHIGCATKYMDTIEYEEETLAENSEWGKCYAAFRTVMGIKESRPLSKHAVLRLRGLRIGKYYPKGENVKNIKRGYTYEEIRLTILYCTPSIRQALGKNSDWKNGDHQVNYVMTIIANNINFIAERVEKKKETEKKLESIPDEIMEVEYKPFKNKVDKGRVKVVKSKIDEDLEREKQEIDELESMFN